MFLALSDALERSTPKGKPLDDLFGTVATKRDGSEILHVLQQAARERILMLDGAAGLPDSGIGF